MSKLNIMCLNEKLWLFEVRLINIFLIFNDQNRNKKLLQQKNLVNYNTF